MLGEVKTVRTASTKVTMRTILDALDCQGKVNMRLKEKGRGAIPGPCFLSNQSLLTQGLCFSSSDQD
jgi:hypothetical protein